MRFKKPVISGLLAFIMLFNLFIPAFAYNSQGSTTDLENLEGIDEVQDSVATEYQEAANTSPDTTHVYATRSSTFTALIPKTIILDGVNGDATYVVGAKGDVFDADSITIEPDSNELTLYKKGDTSKTASAHIDQPNTVITGADMEEYVYSTLQGSIQAQGLKAGSWSGQMSFNITLNQTNVPAHKHTLTHVEAVEATEEAAGNIEYWHCTGCGLYYRDEACTDVVTEAETVIAQLEHTHNLIHTASIEATEDTPGSIEYWYCDKCGKYYKDANGRREINYEDILLPSLNERIPFEIIKDNRTKLGYTNDVWELELPTVFKDKEDGNWYEITSIGANAFDDCTHLTNITIPDSVTSIGSSAFAGTNLYSVIIPDSVTEIGVSAFEYCFELESVIIPDSVISIGDYAFDDCYALTSVTIPNSVTFIGDHAFDGCKKMTTVTIPESVDYIGLRAFGHDGLTNITVSSNNLSYSSVDGVLFNKDQSIILQYPISKVGASYTIPSTVTTIGAYAFYNCYNLTTVTIPNSVTSIDAGAFDGCKLTSVTIPNSVTTLGSCVFSESKNIRWNGKTYASNTEFLKAWNDAHGTWLV